MILNVSPSFKIVRYKETDCLYHLWRVVHYEKSVMIFKLAATTAVELAMYQHYLKCC